MSISSELRKLWLLVTDPEFRAQKAVFNAYKRDRGTTTLTDFPNVSALDTVLDVGGYEGDWAATMRADHDATVHVFEPHPRFAAKIKERFAGDPKTHVHDFAIGSSDGTLSLSDDANASSAMISDGPQVEGTIRDAAEAWDALGLGDVAVVKMNIEGGEYDLLPALIRSGLIERVDRLMVQFHNYSAGDGARRDAIRADLEKTHECEWVYPFVWEQWRRRR